jgi:hypothetical protein
LREAVHRGLAGVACQSVFVVNDAAVFEGEMLAKWGEAPKA